MQTLNRRDHELRKGVTMTEEQPRLPTEQRCCWLGLTDPPAYAVTEDGCLWSRKNRGFGHGLLPNEPTSWARLKNSAGLAGHEEITISHEGRPHHFLVSELIDHVGGVANAVLVAGVRRQASYDAMGDRMREWAAGSEDRHRRRIDRMYRYCAIEGLEVSSIREFAEATNTSGIATACLHANPDRWLMLLIQNGEFPYLEDDFYSSPLWRKLRKEVLDQYGARCMHCGAAQDVTVDHIKPRSRYPELELEPENMQVLCRSCNSSKFVGETDYRRVLGHEPGVSVEDRDGNKLPAGDPVVEAYAKKQGWE